MLSSEAASSLREDSLRCNNEMFVLLKMNFWENFLNDILGIAYAVSHFQANCAKSRESRRSKFILFSHAAWWKRDIDPTFQTTRAFLMTILPLPNRNCLYEFPF